MQHKLKWVIGLIGCLTLCLLAGCQRDPESVATDTLNPSPSVSLTTTPVVTPQPSPSPYTFPPTVEVPSICASAPPSRLIIGERARITDEDRTDLNVRAEPGATEDNTPIGKLRVGEVVIVLDGPVCSNIYAWYEVDTGDLEGWIAEGDLDVYYVEPFLGQ